jgi:hypothetical protein
MKPKKCKICQTVFTPIRALQMVCGAKCGIEYGIRQTAKREQKKVNEYKKELRVEKMKAKESLIDYRKILQFEVQKIARLIDFKCLCLARNIVPRQAHGGHVFSRGSNANFALNLHNIFLQSAASNHFQNDDGLMRDGVVRVFGSDYLDFITSLKSTPVQKYTNEDYKLFLQKARQIIKQLTEWNNQLQQPRSATSRIHLRNWVNVELGIYANEYCNF